MKKIIVWAVLALMVTFFVTACTGDSISGSWERNNTSLSFNDNEYGETIVFSGKTFTNTFYVIEETLTYEPPPPTINPELGIIPPSGPVPPSAPQDASDMNMFRVRYKDGDFNKKLIDSNTRESSSGRIYECELYQVTVKGTYSLTEDKIEFVLSDKTVSVGDITCTENTMKIEGMNFTRSGLKRG
ncbi:MAG: hypothetical protein FWD44_00165 [Oscillospiraceae bacterium]|nr:hypothetical protein [Oscillospiraceae bacterium]